MWSQCLGRATGDETGNRLEVDGSAGWVTKISWTASIDQRASFEAVRYAQAWEDADVLLGAFHNRPGQRFLSICAAGDNVPGVAASRPA